MKVKDRIVDVKSYVDWVNTEPNINGFKSYFEAYKSLKQEQKSLVNIIDEE